MQGSHSLRGHGWFVTNQPLKVDSNKCRTRGTGSHAVLAQGYRLALLLACLLSLRDQGAKPH